MARVDEEGLLGDVVDGAAGAAGRGKDGVGALHDLETVDGEGIDVALGDVVETVDRRAVDLKAAHGESIKAVGQSGFGDAGDVFEGVEDADGPDVFEESLGDDVDGLRRVEDGGAETAAAGDLGGLVAVGRFAGDFEGAEFDDFGGRGGLGEADGGGRESGEDGGETRTVPDWRGKDHGR